MSAPFVETTLDLGIVYGTTATYRYNTTVLANSTGAEQRNSNWSQPLASYDIGNKMLDREELDLLITFHEARKGSLEGFRFKDWIDYRADNQVLGIGDGATQQFQLLKTYTVGSLSTIRPITKPVAESMTMQINGNPTTAFTLNPANGLVTFAAAPPVGAIIAADFEFDVPVRFEVDDIAFRFEAWEEHERCLFSLDSLKLIEVRVHPALAVLPAPTVEDLGITLDLGYDLGTVGGNRFDTLITAVAGGNERRDAQRSEPLGRWNIGNRSLHSEDKDYVLAFFRCCKGAASTWQFYEWAQATEITTRFETDQLSIRLDAVDLELNQAIYNLSGLSVIQNRSTVAVSYTPFPAELTSTPLPCRPIPCNPRTLTFQDNDFNDSDWELLHLTTDEYDIGQISATQQIRDANNKYRAVTITAIAQNIRSSLLYSVHTRNNFAVNLFPGESISGVTFEFDRAIVLLPYGNQPAVGLAIIQNNKIYKWQTNDGLENWHTISQTNLTAVNFNQVGILSTGAIQEDENSHPNFSESLQFGLFVADTNLFPGAPGWTVVIGVDNLKITVNTACA